MPTPARSKATPAEPDEAQQVDAEQAPQESEADRRARFSLEAINNATALAVNRLKGEWGPRLDEITEELANLTALAATPLAAAEPDTATSEILANLVDRVTQQQQSIRELDEALVAVQRAPSAVLGTASGVPRVYSQVLELMRRVEEIGKNKRASYGEGRDDASYQFRGIDEAMDAVGSAMRFVGLVMETEVVNTEHDSYRVDKMNRQGQKYGETQWSTTRVTVAYTFISPEDGSRQRVEGYGVGKDFGDKDGSKALAAAMKYALFQGLCIPVRGMNIDPETESADSGDVPEPEYAAPVGGGQQQRPAETPAAPAKSPEQRAHDAFAAAYGPRATSREFILSIGARAKAEGLLEIQIDGVPLSEHLHAALQTFPEEF